METRASWGAPHSMPGPGDAVLTKCASSMGVIWVFPAMGSTVLGLRWLWLEGAECGVSRLGCECPHCTRFFRWLCVCEKGWGREMAPVPLFLEKSLREL